MTHFDRVKLRSLVFHALATSEPGQLSAADLNLVVFLAELIHLGETGETISGETFVKGRSGPVATHLSAVRAALVADGVIQEGVIAADGAARIALRLADKTPAETDAILPLAALELSSLGLAMEHIHGLGRPGVIPDLDEAYDLESMEIGAVIDLRLALGRRAEAAVA